MPIFQVDLERRESAEQPTSPAMPTMPIMASQPAQEQKDEDRKINIFSSKNKKDKLQSLPDYNFEFYTTSKVLYSTDN